MNCFSLSQSLISCLQLQDLEESSMCHLIFRLNQSTNQSYHLCCTYSRGIVDGKNNLTRILLPTIFFLKLILNYKPCLCCRECWVLLIVLIFFTLEWPYHEKISIEHCKDLTLLYNLKAVNVDTDIQTN